MLRVTKRNARHRKGQGLVEYALIIAGVALICAAAVSVFGHKVSDMIGASAAVLPGAHADDNGAITSGKLIETTSAADGDIQVDAATISTNSGSTRLGNNLGMDLSGLVVEAGEDDGT